MQTPSINKMSPQFLVTDLQRSIDFYTQQLGFDLEFVHEDFYACMIKDGHSIHLKHGTPHEEERKNKQHHHHLDIVFGVTAVRILYDEYLNKDINIVQPLCERPYGTEFYIADPDGYMLAFLE